MHLTMLLVLFVSMLICAGQSLLAAPPARVLLPEKTTPIAAWDGVPFERFKRKFNVGIVAFHETGVRVTFTVNGVARPVIEEPTFNPQSKVWEYWIELDAGKLPPGKVEVGAIVKPKGEGHLEKPMEPMTVYSDPNESLAGAKAVYVDAKNGNDNADGSAVKPFLSLPKAVAAAGDGGTVFLKPGEYVPASLGNREENRKYWTTLTPAPGVSRDDVVILSGRPFLDKVCFRNLSMCARGVPYILQGSGRGHLIWADGCRIWTTEPLRGNLWNQQKDRLYVTGGVSENIQNGPEAVFLRDHVLKDIGEDSFRNSVVVINCSVFGVDRGKYEYHPDFFQPIPGAENATENVIFYNVRGLRCNQQGLSFRDLVECAFVNVLFETPDGRADSSQFAQRMHHVLIWNVVVQHQIIFFREDARWKNPVDCKPLYMENMVVGRGIAGTYKAREGLMLQSCLVGKPWPEVEKFNPQNWMVGTPVFEAPENGDYRLKASSPGYRKGVALPGVPADINGMLYDPQKPDLGCFSTMQPAQAAGR